MSVEVLLFDVYTSGCRERCATFTAGMIITYVLILSRSMYLPEYQITSVSAPLTQRPYLHRPKTRCPIHSLSTAFLCHAFTFTLMVLFGQGCCAYKTVSNYGN